MYAHGLFPRVDFRRDLMSSLSPLVDCGVHYVDVMCQMTQSNPVQVQAIGARLTNEIDQEMYNYGQLQVFKIRCS